MSNWLSEYSGEEQRQVDEVNRQGIAHPPTQQQKEPGLFSGAAASIPKGITAGTAKVLDTVFKPIDAVTDRLEHTFKDLSTNEFIEPYSEFKQKRQLERTSTFAVPAATPLGIDATAPENRLGCFFCSIGACAIPCRFTSSTWRCSSPEYSDSQFDII